MKINHPRRRTSHRTTLPGLVILLVISLLGLAGVTSARAWEASDPVEPVFGASTKDAPYWLFGPATGQQLYSEYDLSYLAGHLIHYGAVDISGCPGGALLDSGAATPCGVQAANSQVLAWQNQFNSDIIGASKETGVPPMLIKNIFAWETQFWPQTIYVNTFEYGLGHITEAGADSALRWNKPFYLQICRDSFSDDTCKPTYDVQDPGVRAALMGAVIKKVETNCPTCAFGMDLAKARSSVYIFANTILSNANLVEMTVRTISGKPAIQTVSYNDLWKFSLVSYNAGPGCFRTAYSRTYYNFKKVNWDNLQKMLDPACRGAIDYVDFITKVDAYHPADDPGTTLLPPSAGTPQTNGTSLPTIEGTPVPGFETPIPTLDGTPVPISDGTDTATPTPISYTPTPTGPTPTPTESIPTATPTPVVTLTVGEQLQSPHVPDELLLKIDPLQRSQVLDTLQTLGVDVADASQDLTTGDTLLVQVLPDMLEKVLAGLQDSTGVLVAEPNYIASLASLPNDPELINQSSLWNIQVPATWDALPSMQEVLVAVLDTGVDASHPDLAYSIWQNAGEVGLDFSGSDKRYNGIDDDGNGYVDDWQGWNSVSGTNNISDDNGHGTHLAGIIAAGVNNAIGMAGVAPNARILPVKVLDNSGYGSYAQVAEGIRYATDMGARIINLGFAGLGSSQVLQEAVDYAVSHGVLLVAASGNGGMNTTYYPAAYPGVIAVSAVDVTLNWAPFSSSGDHISLVAPGVGILSTYPGGTYKTFSGTSMASAEVSGVAALLAGQPQFSTYDSLRSALLGSAFDLGSPGKDSYFGYGIVHAFDALGYSGPVLPTPTPWVVPTSTPGGVGGLYMQASETLWGRTQTSTFPIVNSANSIDGAFNDLLASSTGAFAAAASRSWTIDSIDDTGLASIALAYLDIRFYITGWVDDTLYIQVYDPSLQGCGSSWCNVMTLRSNPSGSGQMLPPSTLTTVTMPVINLLNTPTKVNNARVRISGSAIIGAAADNITIYLDEARIQVMDVLPTPTPTPLFMPTPTLPASRAITATPLANEPHNNFMDLSTDQCAKCHRTHSAQSQLLRNLTGEEQVCYTCHKSGGIGTDVQSAFTGNPNTSSRYFSHPVGATVNIHLPEENLGASFGGVNRHVECEDCHAPHSTARSNTPGSVVVPSIQQEMFNSSGVNPIWVATGTPADIIWTFKADREYQVCMKCHSSFSNLPSYVPDGYGWTESSLDLGFITNGLAKLTSSNPAQVNDSRDMAKEFNPYQVSFHPVAALGRNQSMPAGSFVPGWSQSSLLYCTDCHQNASAPTGGTGPHGSPQLHLLDGSSQYITRTSNNQSGLIHSVGEICFKCHQYNTYANSANPVSTTHFRDGSTNLHGLHEFVSCYTCHDSHGSEREHLINFDLSVVSPYTGYNSQTAWEFNSLTGTGTCYIGCHTADHGSGKSYKP